jgi:hypothetical protein
VLDFFPVVLCAFWSAIRNADASQKVGALALLSFHPGMKDFYCCGLVDEVFLLFRIFPGLMEFGGGGDGGEGFVGKVEGELGVLSFEFLGEAADFFYGITLGAIEPKRQSDDERANAALLDDFSYAGEGIGFVDVNGFHGMCHDA